MPTYILELPEEGETKALLITLVSTLERLNGIKAFDAIGIVLPVGNPAAELIRSLARDVIPERTTFEELIHEGGTIEVTVPPYQVIPEVPVETTAANGEYPVSAVEAAIAKVSNKTRKCPLCGTVYHPSSNRQMFCSKHCRISAAAMHGNGSRKPVQEAD